MKKVYLVLQQGDIFEGYAFGATGEAIGEIVFTTSAVGYLETLTNPSYAGKIVMQTFPLVGNYGVISEDIQGECLVNGYVVREWCSKPSNFRCGGDLDEFLREKGVVGIYGVDTREITRIIRENGIMNAKICEEIPTDRSDIESYKITDSIAKASCKTAYTVGDENAQFSVTLIDYGTTKSVIDNLVDLGCKIKVVPFGTSAADILAEKPDGIVLSDGPGNPNENTDCIAQIKALCGQAPIMALGLGHQMLALANGGTASKMKVGHHGASQPVHEMNGTRTYITAQNHCYAVDSESLGENAAITFVNINDHTCEGIDYPNNKAFSVQFNPDALTYKKFIGMMGGEN